MDPRTRGDAPRSKDVPQRLSKISDIASIFLILAIYFLVGNASLRFASIHAGVTSGWFLSGIALAGFLLLGYRIWPGVLLGAFLVNWTITGPFLTSCGIAIGNTLEGMTGAFLVIRFARGCKGFYRTQDIFRFVFLTGFMSPVVSATFGATSLCLGGLAGWPNYGSIWVTWWLVDGVSNVVIAPLFILWSRITSFKWTRSLIIEAAVLIPLLVVVGQAVFGGLVSFQGRNYPLEFLCIPLLIWAAFRFGGRGAALANFILYAIAIRGTLNGLGPFAIGPRNEPVLLLDLFIAIVAVMGLVLAAAAAERNRAAERFGRLVEFAPNAIVAANQMGEIVFVNRQAEKILGYRREELVGQSVEVLVPERFRSVHPDHRLGFASAPTARPMGAGRELYAIRKDGSEFPIEIGLNPIETEHGMLVLSAIVDITERKRGEAEIRRLVSSDPLTGLANYRRLLEVFKLEAERAGRTGRAFSLLLLDLDGLKKINDTHGHLVGSRALCRLAFALQHQCRVNDTAARHGGDEFSVILPETDLEGAKNLAWRVSEQLDGDLEHPPLSFSFGIASFPQDGSDFDQILENADHALYDMKRAREKQARAKRKPFPLT